MKRRSSALLAVNSWIFFKANHRCRNHPVMLIRIFFMRIMFPYFPLEEQLIALRRVPGIQRHVRYHDSRARLFTVVFK